MNTKIDGLPPGVPRPTSGNPQGSAPKSAESGRSTSTAGDSVVRVSGEAAGLASLERSLSESPAFDTARVAALRSAIESGSYRADAEQIAARMAAMERMLGA
jgi:negative regulator of flagellin synthesis FlgM